MTLRRILLLIGGLEILIVGLIYLFAPRMMMGDLAMPTVNHIHMVRAGYGGAFVGFGALFLAGAIRPELERTALVALIVFMGAFALGRIVSIIMDGTPQTLFEMILISEIILVGLALYAINRRQASS